MSCFGIELHNVSLVASLLDGTTVEFFEGTFECDNDIGWLRRLGLIQAAITVCKNALLDIITGNVAVFQEEISILQLCLEVALGVHPHEVSTADSFAFWSNAAFLKTILTIDVIDRLIFNYQKLETVKYGAK